VDGEIESGDDAEGKDLALMGMSGKLQVKQTRTAGFHHRPVFQQQSVVILVPVF